MRTACFVMAMFLSAVPSAHSQPDTLSSTSRADTLWRPPDPLDTLQLPARVDVYKQNLVTLQMQQRELDLALQNRLEDLERSLKEANNATKRVQVLERRTQALEDYNQSRETNARLQVSQRYEAGKYALKDMTNGVVIIRFMQKFVNLEQDINRVTNLWSDSTFRNFWDDIERIGTSAGFLLAGGALLSGEKASKDLFTGGVFLSGVSALLGYCFGDDNSEVLREKAEFIDLTRRAYDDLNTRYYALQRYISANDSLEGRLTRFQTEYAQRTSSLDDTVQAVSQVKQFYQEYELVLKQIPTLLTEFESMQRQYIMKDPRMKSIIDGILQKVLSVRKEFDQKVLPILDLSTEIKRILES